MKSSGYGFDNLSRDMLVLGVLLEIIALGFYGKFAGLILCVLSTLMTALILYRILSTNINKRNAELRGYEIIRGSVKAFFQKIFNTGKNDIKKHSSYRYFRCPKCKQKLRAPRHKGKIRVTCSSCGTQFEKRT